MLTAGRRGKPSEKTPDSCGCAALCLCWDGGPICQGPTSDLQAQGFKNQT